MLMSVITQFLLYFLSVKCKVDDRKIRRFEDIQSQEIIERFDSFPLQWEDVRGSGWCEGVQILEQVREVAGQLYSKVSLVDSTIIQPIVNTNTGETTQILLRPVLNCFADSDQELVAMVKDIMIEHDTQTEYNLSKPIDELLEQQKNDPFDLSVEMNQEIFKGQLEDGFFIEAGAFEGDEDSHSLLFESKYNWSGLLVEPIQIDVLKSKNRKSWLAPFCLATEARPHFVEFDIISAFEIDSTRNKRAMRGIVQEKTPDSSTVQCVPLYTMLLALGNPTVNWFILDIEGAEYQVLQTIPWHLVDIEMISVETDLAGLIMPGSRQEIIDYMKEKGYIHRKHHVDSHFKTGAVKDDLFIREDVYKRYAELNTNSKILKDEL